MSLRDITRKPAKRMLVFFPSDQTTSVLGTNKVKKVLGNKLEEGAAVLVEYGKMDYEGYVVKLHDDPSILMQEELNFLKENFAGDEILHEVDETNKVNNPSKQQKLCRPKTTKRKDPQAKSKKGACISFESEGLPWNNSKPGANTQKVPSKPTNEPGSISFLNEEEVQKVEKIISHYRKGDGKEVAVQTYLASGNCNSEETLAKSLMDKESQTDVPFFQCQCESLIPKFDLLQQKVDVILSLLAIPKNNGQHQVFDCEDLLPNLEVKELCNEPMTPTTHPPLSKEAATNSIPPVTPTDTPLSMPPATPNESPLFIPPVPEAQPLNPLRAIFLNENSLETSPTMLSIPDGICEETFKKSSSVSNFAKNLVFGLFTKEELLQSNCAGTHEKKSLEKDPRMSFVKDVTFKRYKVADKQKSWGACRKAIDSAIRKIRFRSSV